MSRYKNMVLTSQGRRMLAKLQKRECDMVVTRAAIGYGSYDVTEDLSLAEGLKDLIQSFGVSSFEREDDQLLIRFVASNFDLETNAGNQTDYYLTEIGIYARESGVDDDFLYAIAVADVPAFLPAYDEASPVTITFSTYIYIGNEGDVSIHADPTAYALAADLRTHAQNKENPHNVTKTQVGLEHADNTSDLQKPVSVAQKKAINDAQAGANQFTLQKIAALINGAPETLDTLKEVAEAISENRSVVAALDAAVGKKANQSEVGTHTGNTTIHITRGERDTWNGKLTPSGNASDTTVVFTQASSRANLRTGEKLSVIFGKIAKWFSDLKAVAFTGNYNDLFNRPAIPVTHIKTFSNISVDEYQSANNVGLGEGYFWPCYYNQLKEIPAFSDVENYSDVPINFYVSLHIPGRRYEGIAHYVLWNKKFYLLGQDAPCPYAAIKPFRSCTADYITFIGFMVSDVYKDTFSLTICATY